MTNDYYFSALSSFSTSHATGYWPGHNPFVSMVGVIAHTTHDLCVQEKRTLQFLYLEKLFQDS